MLTTLIAHMLLAQGLTENPKIQPTQENIKNVAMLKGGVSAVDMLPDEIYGKWSVKSVLVQATDTEDFKGTTSDIWVFRRFGEHITLTNPVTQASASINVDEVVNNKARFSRETFGDGERERETVEIYIRENEFYGTDTFVIEKYENGKLISQDVVKYKLRGSKISGQESIFKR